MSRYANGTPEDGASVIRGIEK